VVRSPVITRTISCCELVSNGKGRHKSQLAAKQLVERVELVTS
jgi:hypothetical protein